MGNRGEVQEHLRKLLQRIPVSGSYESAALSQEVSELISTMTDEILASSEGTGGPFLLVPTKYAFYLFTWLSHNGVTCATPRDALFLDDQPTDAVIEVDKRPNEMEPILDKWFALLQVKCEKRPEGPVGDPTKIHWQYNVDAYRSAVITQLRADRFLRPAS